MFMMFREHSLVGNDDALAEGVLCRIPALEVDKLQGGLQELVEGQGQDIPDV